MKEGVSLEAARAAKQKALTALEGRAEINGVGITRVGTGYGIKVNLSVAPPASSPLPQEVDGVPVVVEVVGRILKQNAS